MAEISPIEIPVNVVFQHDLAKPCNCKTCQTQHRLDEEAHEVRLAAAVRATPAVMAPRKLPGADDYVDDHKDDPKPDMVNHPPHYKRGGLETIDVIEAWGLGFCLGNTVKYIARAGHKGSALEDLKKARWYLDREIAKLDAKGGAK